MGYVELKINGSTFFFLNIPKFSILINQILKEVIGIIMFGESVNHPVYIVYAHEWDYVLTKHDFKVF